MHGTKPNHIRLIPALCLAALLAGCARPSPPIPAPTAETSPLTGKLTTGTIVAIRQADLTQNTSALNAVLAALGQTKVPSAGPATEIIIRRPDNSFTSIIQPPQSSFTPGQNVTIVEAAATVLRPD